MLNALITLFRKEEETLTTARNEFLEMLNITSGMFKAAVRGTWEEALDPGERSALYKADRRVNKLERAVRRRVETTMFLRGRETDLAACVLLLHVVKDAERIGDYCKNLSEIREYDARSLADDELSAELKEIADEVGRLLDATPAVMGTEGETDTAVGLLQEARELGKRCDQMLVRIARCDKDPSAVTVLVLLSRFYKRISAHTSNILSAVVMPLHKMDYFDERELPNRD
jgi:phosphate transport system protein